MKAEFWIYTAAGYNAALALFHLGFWRIFRWTEELAKLHPVNRGVMQVLNLMLTYCFLLMAALQVLLPGEMVGSRLGRLLLAGMMGFWVVRAALQPLFWRSLPATTNAVYTTLFLVGAGLHAAAYSAGVTP